MCLVATILLSAAVTSTAPDFPSLQQLAERGAAVAIANPIVAAAGEPERHLAKVSGQPTEHRVAAKSGKS